LTGHTEVVKTTTSLKWLHPLGSEQHQTVDHPSLVEANTTNCAAKWNL